MNTNSFQRIEAAEPQTKNDREAFAMIVQLLSQGSSIKSMNECTAKQQYKTIVSRNGTQYTFTTKTPIPYEQWQANRNSPGVRT